MRAMVLSEQKKPLELRDLPRPEAGPGQVLVRVEACGVCRTDLHVAEGDLPEPKLPLVLGHETVGRIEAIGDGVEGLEPGARVGVPWLGWTCGTCEFCRGGQENLCRAARFTGYTLDGGYAEYTVADARYAFPLPEGLDAVHAAPLLCAGLIGFRAYRFAGDARRLGLYGFGAAAHILAQIARSQDREVYAYTRPGDTNGQKFARSLGAVWAGDSTAMPPEPLDAAILFAPVGALVPGALEAVRPGGTVVCAGIHMSDIPSFPYRLLWEERRIVSVANLTREDGLEFFDLVSRFPVRTTVHRFPLTEANEALRQLREGAFEGAAVLGVARDGS
jgi:propanol-preferring alcohol dehydrogenase